jgi:neural Wiskott-Aldrich syndrome protein
MPQPFADQFKSIAMSPDLNEALERAHGFAREQGHRTVTLEHLLLAFTEDVDASAVLEASNVDLVRLGTDVSGYLGRLLEDMRAENGADPTTDPELLRVLHAAVQAAQQSRRRQIDGAIVLAAVVGDGKSPAAGLLKAHGLTFEEAIRALQKANAKANAQARSKQFATPATPAPAAAPIQPAPASSESGSVVLSPQSGMSEPAGGTHGAGQSVEDILAAARARIQQRTTAIVGKSAEPAQAPLAPPTDPDPPQISSLDVAAAPVSPPEPDDSREETQLSPVEPPASPPLPPPPASLPRPSWTPPAAAPGPPSARLPQPSPQRPTAPFPHRPAHAGDGPPRPPLPQRLGLGSGQPIQPGLPTRPPRAPWPDGHEPASSARPQATNGAIVEAPPATARRPGQRTGGQAGQGPLVETIPRRMRVGVPATAQVRISRDRVDSLILLLMKGRGVPHRPETLITRALSVRLRAPDGGFWIEAASPETQWMETASGLHQDEHVTWRWTVTPQGRGRSRLVLAVSARTVGHDGLAAETAPPDRTIEVTVTGGRLRRLAGWGGFLVALLLGAVLGRFGNEVWALGAAIGKRLIGG